MPPFQRNLWSISDHDSRHPFCNACPGPLTTKLGNDAAVFHRHTRLGPLGGGTNVNSHDFTVKLNSGLTCLTVEVSKSHTIRHTQHGRTPLNKWSPQYRGCYLHNKHEINIHALRGIQTHNPSHQVASDLSLRWNGHQGWLVNMRNFKLLGFLIACANLKYSLFKLYYTSTAGRIYTNKHNIVPLTNEHPNCWFESWQDTST